MTGVQRRNRPEPAVTTIVEHMLVGTMKVYRENKEVSRSGRRTGAKLPFGERRRRGSRGGDNSRDHYSCFWSSSMTVSIWFSVIRPRSNRILPRRRCSQPLRSSST